MALTPKQERFAALLASGRSVRAAAAELGVSDKTGRNWLAALPELREAVDRLSTEMQGQAVAILSRSLAAAAATLTQLLNEKHPPTVRCSAARAILADYISLRQFTDLAGEVERLRAEVERIGREQAPGYGRTA